MLEDTVSILSSAPRNPAATSNPPAPAEHPKTTAARLRATRPIPLEVALLTTSEVARALRVTPITVFRYAQKGLLRPIKLGDGSARAPRRYRAVDIARFIEERLAASGVSATE
jgi:hypothetical protein